MLKKLSTLLISSVMTLVLFLAHNSVEFNLCVKNDLLCREKYDLLENSFYIFPLILFFSIITFRLPDPVFQCWYRFTLVTAPVVILLVFLINLGWHHTHGGWFNTSAMFDWPAQVFLYLIYVVGSIFVITRNYWQYRKAEELNSVGKFKM